MPSMYNANARFSQAPTVSKSRSRFKVPFERLFTCDTGKMIPFLCKEVLPGDTFDLDFAFVSRMSTPRVPVFNAVYQDFYWFFVPARLCWSHWKNLMGENDSTPWFDSTVYSVPKITLDSGVAAGSIGDYLGLPLGSQIDTVAGGSYPAISALPGRAIRLIYNRYFRSEAYQSPKVVNTGDSETDATIYGDLYDVDRYHDYFSSCLPSPQRGPAVLMPIADAPVYAGTPWVDYGGSKYPDLPMSNSLKFASTTDHDGPPNGSSFGNNMGMAYDPDAGFAGDTGIFPSNLYANVSDVAPSINALRLAFQTQRLYELDARSGTRYFSYLQAHFGVTAPDATLQDPEYLGGSHIQLNMEQVLQTSSTDAVSPQGSTAGMSKTRHAAKAFPAKSFVEHGFLVGVTCFRTDRLYQNGLDRMWTRSDRFDYYDPIFANLGEQPVYNREIYLSGHATDEEYAEGVYGDLAAFGYQEAWAEYRQERSYVAGDFRSNSPNGSLDFWHFADYYNGVPVISDGWLREGKSHVARTLAQPETSHQWLVDIFCDLDCYRIMPLYSVPGLIDHN